MNRLKRYLAPLLPLLLLINALPAEADKREFSILVIPTLMGPEMDPWYHTPREAAPAISRTTKVAQGEMFQLLVIAGGYRIGPQQRIDMTYDVQVYDPQGEPTQDRGESLQIYQGSAQDPAPLILSRQYLRIVFTEKYPPGDYTIRVTAHDNVAGRSVNAERTIALAPFTLPPRFASDQALNEWFMGYHRNPSPEKVISAILHAVQPNKQWAQENQHLLAFFRTVLRDNPFLLEALADNFDRFDEEEKRKLLLVAATLDDDSVKSLHNHLDKALSAFYERSRGNSIMSTDGEISHATQLDILWSEFLASGDYLPVKKIVSALALKRYQGTFDKIKSGELDRDDPQVKQSAYREATYRSAVWSLVSNGKRLDLVFHYCVHIYRNEALDESIKKQLYTVLHLIQEKRQQAQGGETEH